MLSRTKSKHEDIWPSWVYANFLSHPEQYTMTRNQRRSTEIDKPAQMRSGMQVSSPFKRPKGGVDMRQQLSGGQKVCDFGHLGGRFSVLRFSYFSKI